VRDEGLSSAGGQLAMPCAVACLGMGGGGLWSRERPYGGVAGAACVVVKGVWTRADVDGTCGRGRSSRHAVHAEQWHRGLRTGCGTDTMHCTSSRGGGGLDCGGEMADSGEGRGGGSGESCVADAGRGEKKRGA
jgi:hypothetical protein